MLEFHLDAFEGPLDLLLHLIRKNKVSIYDIPISEILEQYMEVVREAETLDMDVSGDFIAMAAQLLYIKSKMLLPADEEEEDDDPRAELVQLLLEYQRMKEVTPLFKEKSEIGRDIFVKEPEPPRGLPKIQYCHTLGDLTKAARNMLEKNRNRMPPPVSEFRGIVGREPVPVATRVTAILKQFFKKPRLLFRRLFDDAHSRSEIVATFLAVLELSKTGRIWMEGEGDEMELTMKSVPVQEEGSA